jgi:endonuclease-3
MHGIDIDSIINILKERLKDERVPVVTELADRKRDPFYVLISTLLSLRTKDEVTEVATKRILSIADTPSDMLKLSEDEIIKAIYPVGFYRNKAKTILHVCERLVEEYDSKVPDTVDELLKLKGVGRKTANLVVTLGHRGKGICVDIHVHRISNRLGYVKTKTPDETEFALRKKLPEKYWTDYNTIMVAFGRTVCRPVSPFCSTCPVESCCEKVGVTRNR